MNWEKVIQEVTPYIFKIETPAGDGTGFLYLYNEDKTICGVATALHVIDYANTWKQPIRLTHHSSSGILFLRSESQYIVFPDWKTDSAVILFQKQGLEFPSDLIELIPVDQPLGIGNEVSWLGFPAIEPYTLCFFSGNISARQEFRKAYLIDGVAINGVSGGPVTYLHGTEVRIVGIVSSYRANRVTGDTLPGLLYAQDVSHFHDVIRQVQSIDDANKKKREIEQQQQAEKGLKQQAAPVDAEKLRTP